MSLTHFPNGITTQAVSAENASAGVGDLNCQDLFADGSITVPNGKVLGETVTMMFTMGSVSTARAVYAPVPVNGTVIRASVVVGATVAVNTLHSFLIGSAGASLATITATSGTAGQITTTGTITNATVTTADSIQVTRAVQGTVGDTWASVVIARTS